MNLLTTVGQTALGPYRQRTLGWPAEVPPLLPGQHLRLGDGTRLWPMRTPSGERLETLSTCGEDAALTFSATIEGSPLDLPEGDILLLAQGLGLAPLIHLCERLRVSSPGRLLALYEPPAFLPFRPRPSRFLVEHMPPGVIAAIPLLEDWGIPSRLASPSGLPGGHEGGLEALFAALSWRPHPAVIAMGDADFASRMAAAGPVDRTIILGG